METKEQQVKQKEIYLEIKALQERFKLDPEEVYNAEANNVEEQKSKTKRLEKIKKELINSIILKAWSYLDLGFDIILSLKVITYIDENKIEEVFHEEILENLRFLDKLEAVNKLIPFPDDRFLKNIKGINVLRNAVSHSFHDVSRLKGKRSFYRGKDIYSNDGFGLFIEDNAEIVTFMDNEMDKMFKEESVK